MPELRESRPATSAQGRKARVSSATADDRRDALLSQVAVRYYRNHETQEEIAQAIGRSVATVSRLLTRAEDAGVVEMDVAQPHTLVPALQAALVKRFGIRVARVVHVAPAETHTIVPRIGDLAARYLATILGHGSTLTISWGNHVQAVALAMPAMTLRDAHVVQGIGSRGATMPQLVHPRLVQSIAMRIEATPHFLPAPLLAATAAERDAIARDPYFGTVLERIAQTDVALLGIGSTDMPYSALHRAGILDEWELERVCSVGAVGEMLAEFFDIQGRIVCNDISRRVVGMREAQMRQSGTVLSVASGEGRAPAILGALRSGIVDVLVTDSQTTRAVLALAGLVLNVLIVSRWFVQKRGTALGLTLVGTSLGGIVFPRLGAMLLKDHTWREAMLMAAVIPLIALLVMALVTRDSPADMGLRALGAPLGGGASPSLTGMEYKDAIRTRTFWILTFCAMTTFYCILAAQAHMVLHLKGMGWPLEKAASGVGILFTMGLVGKFGIGYLADKMERRVVFLSNIAIMLLGALLLASMKEFLLWPFILIFGLGWGGLYTMLQLTCMDSFGTRAGGKILGTITVLDAIGGGLGIWITGVLFDRSKSYESAFILIATLVFLAFLAALALQNPQTTQKEPAEASA